MNSYSSLYQGGGLNQRLANNFDNAICVLKDLVVPEPQYPEAAGCQSDRALLIPFNFLCILATVDLDHEPSLEASEIGDVRPDWNLTAKAVAFDLFSAQSEPEAHFSVGHLLAERAGALNIGA